MRLRRASANPFYVVLIVVGIAFCLTACAYGMMAVRALRTTELSATEPQAGLIPFMDRHGTKLMAVEIAVLAVATVGAISTDNYWSRNKKL